MQCVGECHDRANVRDRMSLYFLEGKTFFVTDRQRRHAC